MSVRIEIGEALISDLNGLGLTLCERNLKSLPGNLGALATTPVAST